MLKFRFYKLVSSWEKLPQTIFTQSKHRPLKKRTLLFIWIKIKALFSDILCVKFEYNLLSGAGEEEQVYNNDNDDDDKILIKISHLTIRSKNVGQKCVLFLMKMTYIIQLNISILSKTYRHTFVQSSDYGNH